ncbi:hypothetical protein cypCar_00014870 [Cyprinus carpio]|nr:hypothetical protein cypCar_00014870 [Cyprinus carpio]
MQEATNCIRCPDRVLRSRRDSGKVRNNPKRFPAPVQPHMLVIGMLPGEKGKSPYVTCRARRYKDGDDWVNYSQPLVAVKFMNLTLNTDVNVECTINSNSNITQFKISERDKFAGRVIFKLRINTM